MFSHENSLLLSERASITLGYNFDPGLLGSVLRPTGRLPALYLGRLRRYSKGVVGKRGSRLSLTLAKGTLKIETYGSVATVGKLHESVKLAAFGSSEVQSLSLPFSLPGKFLQAVPDPQRRS